MQKACLNDYNLWDKAVLETRAFVLYATKNTWLLALEDEDTLYIRVTPYRMMQHLQNNFGGSHTVGMLKLRNDMQTYHVWAEGIMKYINLMEEGQMKIKKRGALSDSVTNVTLLLYATNAMILTEVHSATTETWEDLQQIEKTWKKWKELYEPAVTNERVRHQYTGGEARRIFPQKVNNANSARNNKHVNTPPTPDGG